MRGATPPLCPRASPPATGKTTWQRSQANPDYTEGLAALGLPDGGAVLTGVTTLHGNKRVFLERVDTAGKAVWRRTYLTEQRGGRGLSLGTWAGGYLVGTRVFMSSNPAHDQPGQIKTDAFGFAGCAAAGACLKKTCDDKNACTTDWCDPAGGCKHTPIAGC